MDEGSEFGEGSWEGGSGFLLSLLESSFLLAGLVEEGFDQGSDVLSKMGSLNCVVVLRHRFINLVFIFFVSKFFKEKKEESKKGE